MSKSERCPHCGREIQTYEKDGQVMLYGHRVTMPHTPETPWCPGASPHAKKR